MSLRKQSHAMLELVGVKPLSYISQLAEFLCVDGDSTEWETSPTSIDWYTFEDESMICINNIEQTVMEVT